MFKRLHSYLLLLFCCTYISAQEKILLSVSSGNEHFPGDSVKVELTLHADNADETSSVVYVDLLNATGDMIQLKKLKVVDGKANTVFWIDSIHPSGYYELRAYTRDLMMKQFELQQQEGGERLYASKVLPVFRKSDKKEALKGSPIRHIDRESWKGRERPERYRYDWNWRCENPQYQRKEKSLTFVGHLEPRKKEPSEEDYRQMENRKLYVTISKDDCVHQATVKTDQYGRFACAFPDVAGEWKCMVFGEKGENLSGYRVVNDRLFAPSVRTYEMDELEVAGVKLRDDASDKTYKSWYFDCDANVEMSKGLGFVSQDFFEWLHDVNKNFDAVDDSYAPQVLAMKRDSTVNAYLDINLFGKDSNDKRTVCADGMKYVYEDYNHRRTNRPVVWVINGGYRLITGLKKKLEDFVALRPTKENIPLYIDEVKSVFISEEPKAYRPYVQCGALEIQQPVTVLITLHQNMLIDDALLYSGHFFGFDNLDTLK